MTDLSRVEELLLELVTQQGRLIDRVERLEGVMTELHHDRESDVREAVVTAIGSELQLVVVNLEQIKDALDWTAQNSFAGQLHEELQWHKDLTFANSVITRLDAIESSISALDR